MRQAGHHQRIPPPLGQQAANKQLPGPIHLDHQVAVGGEGLEVPGREHSRSVKVGSLPVPDGSSLRA